MIKRMSRPSGYGIGFGPAGFRVALSRHYGDRWWFGGVSISIGTGFGGYIGLVIGEWIDDAPHSIGCGPVQVVAH